jgi:multiple sugar transport system substrate-binding protein
MFQEQEGVDLKLEAEALDLHPLYETLFEQEGLRRGWWDVAFVVTDWFATAHETQALLDLAPLIKANPPDDYPQGWTPSLLKMQQFGEQIIGLPYHDGPECFIYRQDLFADPQEQAAYQAHYGTPLQVPQSWAEFQQVARFFNRPAQNLYGTIFAAYPDGHNTVYDFSLQLWTRGGELFDSSGRMTLDTPAAIQALEYYRMILNDSSAVHPQAREADSVKAGFAFARGEVAMMVNWFGFAGMSETIAESKVKGKVGVTTIPHAENCSSASLNVYWVLGIGAGSPHADIAYKFLRFCAAAAMDKMLTLEGAIGCRRTTWQDADVNHEIPFYNKMEALHTYARELPRLSNWAQLAAVIDELVLAVINTQRPVAELTREAQAKIDRM